jgi:DNA-binding NarL/FixJ family response regulator
MDRLFDHMGYGVVLCDSTWRLRRASPRGAAIVAQSCDRDLPDFLPDSLAAAAAACLERGEPPSGCPVRVPVAGNGCLAVGAISLGAEGTMLLLKRDTSEQQLIDLLRDRYELSRRHLQLVQELRLGHANRVIARRLGLAPSTVKTYLSHLFARLEVRSRSEAVVLIHELTHGW